MKNRIILCLLSVLLTAATAKAQLYDGITQPTRFRLWMPVSVSLDEPSNINLTPFVGYKWDVCKWFSLTPVLQYNVNAKNFIPQAWLNFNVQDKFYILSRSILSVKDCKYKHTLSATYKIPLGFMVDATWENLFDGDKFCDTDRLQVVAGYGYKWFAFNVGYSMRHHPGAIANLRLKLTDYNWLQFKYDQGLNNLQVACALQIN